MTPYRGYLTDQEVLMASETQLSKMQVVLVGLAGLIIIGVTYELFKRYKR